MRKTFTVAPSVPHSMFLYDGRFTICSGFIRRMTEQDDANGTFKVEFSSVRPHQKGWKTFHVKYKDANDTFDPVDCVFWNGNSFATNIAQDVLLREAGNPTTFWARVTPVTK